MQFYLSELFVTYALSIFVRTHSFSRDSEQGFINVTPGVQETWEDWREHSIQLGQFCLHRDLPLRSPDRNWGHCELNKIYVSECV